MHPVFHQILISCLLCPFALGSEPPKTGSKAVPERVRQTIESSGEGESILDPRVQVEKITELSVPAVPSTVVLPAAPIHRIAVDRSETHLDEASWANARAITRRGLAWLESTQSRRGGWMEATEVVATDQPPREAAAAVAVTGLGLKAFAQAPALARSPEAVTRALGFVRAAIEEYGFDGLAAAGLGNYVASSVTMGLAAYGSLSDPGDSQSLGDAVTFLRTNQWDRAEGVTPKQDWYGGAGYGSHGRPDLSNTQMMLDALYDAGVSPDEPVVQKALVFLTRTQNLKATNPAAWAQAGSDDGGFIYTPANDGESFGSAVAGEGRYGETMPEGAARSLRSYGSMTYAGFKSLLYAGLTADDQRVAAAIGWIQRHWTLTENPGLGGQGLYYYIHAMARALRASGLDEIQTLDGTRHDWRRELITTLSDLQRADGSWQNDEDRWEESRPELATIYATLALEEALKPTLDVE
jgi:squalene-hopene/tetraprenyl-beta-curcumene cyclase